MSLSISTALANALLGTNDFAALMNGGKLYIYSAPSGAPANADAAKGGSDVLLATVTESGDGTTGLTLATPPANGVIQKTASEVWKTLAANITAGTAAYYRHCVGSDNGSAAAGASDYRVQGSIGTDMSSDLVVPSTALTTGADFGPITQFGYQMPLAA